MMTLSIISRKEGTTNKLASHFLGQRLYVMLEKALSENSSMLSLPFLTCPPSTAVITAWRLGSEGGNSGKSLGHWQKVMMSIGIFQQGELFCKF